MRRVARSAAVVAAGLCILALCGSMLVSKQLDIGSSNNNLAVELVDRKVETWFLPLAPMERADKLYIYWGEGVSHYDSAKVVHSVLDLSHAPQYINSLEEQDFRGLSLSCCNVLVFPPFQHGFPVYSADSAEARRIARFVAQGNTAVFTGGMTDVLFLNTYFGYHLEPVKGSYSYGPFLKRDERLPAALQNYYMPSKLRQVNTQATVVARASLPYPSVILYDDLMAGTPVFMLKFCMINNPKIGENPLRVNPASCDRWAKRGNPCGCGNIVYIGFNYQDMQEKDWNLLLRYVVKFAMNPPQPSNGNKNGGGGGGAVQVVKKRDNVVSAAKKTLNKQSNNNNNNNKAAAPKTKNVNNNNNNKAAAPKAKNVNNNNKKSKSSGPNPVRRQQPKKSNNKPQQQQQKQQQKKRNTPQAKRTTRKVVKKSNNNNKKSNNNKSQSKHKGDEKQKQKKRRRRGRRSSLSSFGRHARDWEIIIHQGRMEPVQAPDIHVQVKSSTTTNN